MPSAGEEDAVACGRVQHGRIEGDLTARIDPTVGCEATSNRSKRPPPGAARPDRTTARNAPVSDTATAVGCAVTRADGCAGAVDGVDGATHKTAAHRPATAAPATSKRRHAAASNIAQLASMPAFSVETSWRSISM
jgi:hypothetical protein